MAKQILSPNPAKIKVVGCGGGGCNAITRMVREGIDGVEFIAINADAQALAATESNYKLQIGERATRGLGVGGDHTLGRRAAEETQDQIRELVSGSDMVFVAVGMGGGTGTGSAPLVAETAKDTGALTIAVVTKPFGFEGARRMSVAEEGIALMGEHVDTLIVIPNDKLLEVCDMKTVVDSAFKMADDVIMSGVRAITEVITVPGLINLDFADVKAVMMNGGQAWLSIGKGTGPNRAAEAAKAALHSQLLEVSVKGASGVLFNVTGGPNLTIHEVNEAAKVIQSEVHPDANIIFGVVFDPRLDNELHITLVATGFSRGMNTPKTEDLRRLLKRTEEEGELDIPTFIRRPFPVRHTPAVPISHGPAVHAKAAQPVQFQRLPH